MPELQLRLKLSVTVVDSTSLVAMGSSALPLEAAELILEEALGPAVIVLRTRMLEFVGWRKRLVSLVLIDLEPLAAVAIVGRRKYSVYWTDRDLS
jgi:hypothetical protein